MINPGKAGTTGKAGAPGRAGATGMTGKAGATGWHTICCVVMECVVCFY